MRNFFYHTRNVIGLMLVIGPICGCLLCRPLPVTAALLTGSLLGIPLTRSCYEQVNFRLWTGAYGLLFSCGATLLTWPETEIIGGVFAGITAGGFLLILPANMIVNWFRASKSSMLGFCWSGSFLLTGLWIPLLQNLPRLGPWLALISMLTGTLFFLERPPALLIPTGLSEFLPDRPAVPQHRKRSHCKVFIFFLSLSLNVGVILTLDPAADGSAAGSSADLYLPALLTGLILGPLLAAWIAGKQGAFGSAVFLLFPIQGSMLLMGTSWQQIASPLLAYGLLGIAVSAAAAALPLLIYYLYGPGEFAPALVRTVWSLPLGLLAVPLLTSAGLPGGLEADERCTIAMFLLTIGFFTIFSAWKRRLLLLFS